MFVFLSLEDFLSIYIYIYINTHADMTYFLVLRRTENLSFGIDYDENFFLQM